MTMRSYEWIRTSGSWTLAELAWGLDRNLIDLDALKQCELEQAAFEGRLDLAGLVRHLARIAPEERGAEALRLTVQDGDMDHDSISWKWLIAVLTDLYANRNEVDDPLGEVERIYADFYYPERMESFVRYMPATDGYAPAEHSLDQNVERLFENWKRFLDSAG
ncbi:DUF2247 family protein [Stenotrophomonas sp. LGBM10]|uniref:DUF2247 family protein n=1 Tax=Stenotrophomonas sp. LGBM10 TaxID=3390038 RepID=UPI00398BAB31